MAQRAALTSETLAQEVFSPVEGRVLDLAVLPGQPVAPGQKLAGLLPSALEEARVLGQEREYRRLLAQLQT